MSPASPESGARAMLPLALGALGVVFGDIGTSPLYALQTILSTDNHIVRVITPAFTSGRRPGSPRRTAWPSPAPCCSPRPCSWSWPAGRGTGGGGSCCSRAWCSAGWS